MRTEKHHLTLSSSERRDIALCAVLVMAVLVGAVFMPPPRTLGDWARFIQPAAVALAATIQFALVASLWKAHGLEAPFFELFAAQFFIPIALSYLMIASWKLPSFLTREIVFITGAALETVLIGRLAVWRAAGARHPSEALSTAQSLTFVRNCAIAVALVIFLPMPFSDLVLVIPIATSMALRLRFRFADKVSVWNVLLIVVGLTVLMTATQVGIIVLANLSRPLGIALGPFIAGGVTVWLGRSMIPRAG